MLRAVTRRSVSGSLAWLLVSALACSSGEAKPANPAPAPAHTAPASATQATKDPAATAVPPVGPAAHATRAIDPDAVGFFGKPDADVLAKLRSGDVVAVKKGSGGRSLGFKLTFADGTKGYFKVEQTFTGANWYAEVAAYHLDRMLGLGRVAPVVSRRLPWARLAASAEGDERLKEVVVADLQPRADGSMNGTVRGALVAWVEGELTSLVSPPGWENWVRIEPWNAFNPTPFQRAREYYDAPNRPRAAAYQDVPTPDRDDRAAELSDLLVFDFLTLNIDRWGGDNANVLTLETDQDLIFLDNGDGFSLGPPRRSLIDARLLPLQRFRKRTLAALEKFSVEGFAAELAKDPEGSPLSPAMLEGLEQRRKAVLDHAAAQAERLGHDVVYAW